MSRPVPCPERANVLLIGGGGREHALAWKLRQSPRVQSLWLTDAANGGLNQLGQLCPVSMNCKDAFQMQRWCDRNNIHLVVVGPEGPLAAGIADILASDKRQVFGPTKGAARLESDKTFAKKLMRQAAIPTADTRIFHDAETADQYVSAHEDPCVVKAAGLAAGKGAIVCESQDQAHQAIERILTQREFGSAGDKILIEEKLAGQEVSVLALVGGRTIWMLDPCQDHKQVGEGDVGPNTGGMGAYCPTTVLDGEALSIVESQIIVPVVDALRREGLPYCGVLYAGLMLTPAGPKVLEFNCRFGDPECQPLMARINGDLFEILWATCTGMLNGMSIEFDQRTACCVVMCSQGYPGAYEKGKPITGIDEAEALSTEDQQVIVFHSGTRYDDAGQLVTNGGRVLGVTALADDLQAARDLANAACQCIHFEGAFHRTDIGDRILVGSP